MGVQGPGRLQACLQVYQDDGSDLIDRMFRVRAGLFHDRLKWDVSVDERGHECDRYDTPVARYLILADAAGQDMSARLFEAGFEWLAGTEFTSIVAVLFPAMLRVYKRAGRMSNVLNSVDGLVVGQ